MEKKNIASPRISANEGKGVSHTSSECKGNHFLRNFEPLVFVKNQDARLKEAFSENIFSRLQAERVTGVRTSSICRFVADQRMRNAIWSCGLHKDPSSGRLAEFLTMNRALAVDYYKDETEAIWRELQPKGQQAVFKAIDAYLQRKDLGVFIASTFDDCDREVWLKVQDYIDVEMALIRTTNAERRKSIYCDL